MQTPHVVFPDIELWATTYLRAALAARPEAYAANVWVDIAVPNPRTDRMVVVRRDGGPRQDVWEQPRLAVRVWATSEQEATDLARLVRALMWVAADGNPVLRVDDLAGPSAVADDSRQPLRFMTFELLIRGANFTSSAI